MYTLALISASVSYTVSYLLSYIVVPVIARHSLLRGISGVDVHKVERPVCAEMGGVSVMVGFVAGTTALFVIGVNPYPLLVGGFFTVLVAFAVGAFDDIVGVRQRYKPFLIAAGAVPMMLVYDGSGDIWFPLIGEMHFGLFYPLIIIPLGVTIAANLSNMLAGFNGIESGVGMIALSTLGVLCFFTGRWEVGVIAFTLVSAITAFLSYNWYPAKTFPGDAGTLMYGASIAVIGVLGGVEFAAIVVSVPAGFDFALKMVSRRPFSHRRLHGDTRVREDGVLEPAPYPSLFHVFLKVYGLNEKQLVLSVITMEAVFGFIAVFLTLFFF